MPMFETPQRESVLLERKIKRLENAPGIPPALLDLAVAALRLIVKDRLDLGEVAAVSEGLASLDRVAAGAPLLPRERFPWNPDRAEALFLSLAKVLTDGGGPAAQAASELLDQGASFRREALAAHMAADEAFFARFAAAHPGAPRTLAFLAGNSLTPQIMAQAASVSLLLPADRTWSGGGCPVCGGAPFLSRLVGKEGARVNECVFCRASYRVPRLACPYCLEMDPAKLPYFVTQNLPGYRLDTCTNCKTYIKTVDFRDFDLPSLPALDDLESLALDILAAERGLARPTPSALGI